MKTSYLALFFIFLASLLPVYTYDENLARELVAPAGVAYCKPADQLSFSYGPLCAKMKAKGYQTLFAEVLPNGPLTTEAFSIFYKPSSNQVILSFRGTNNPLQLLQELLSIKGEVYQLQPGYSNLRVQAYFYTKYKNTIRSRLLQDLEIVKSKYPTASYIITGHSLGGALATIAALDLSKSGTIDKSKMQVYNFGSPRVGNYEFGQAIAKQGIPFYRIVNSKDPIVNGPPCVRSNNQCSKGPQKPGIWWSPYHVNTEIYYPNSSMMPGEYKTCVDEDISCAAGLTGFNTDLNTHLFYFGERIGCPY